MKPLTAGNLALPGIAHGFFTRQGGVSEGLYASLNCGPGSGDDKEKVAENRTRVAACFGLGPEALLTAYQVHGAEAVIAGEIWPVRMRPECDGIVTDKPGLLLGILTADCAPVLLADAGARVVAAAHAGWKGALGGIIESTVKTMEKQGAKRARIHAAIGPCIAQKSYEVGPEFMARFLEHSPENVHFFTAPGEGGKAYFDLMFHVKHRLQQAGVASIETLAHDTCAGEESFFSYRRATLRGESAYGRQVSCIALIE